MNKEKVEGVEPNIKVVPKEEVDPALKKRIKSGFEFHWGDPSGFYLFYIDREGNIARVEINSEMIDSLKGRRDVAAFWQQVKKELEEPNFIDIGNPEVATDIGREVILYQKKIEEEIKQKKQKRKQKSLIFKINQSI